MEWLRDNRAFVRITLVAAILGLCIGLLVYSFDRSAEAMGAGNLSSESNHAHNLSYGSSGVAASASTYQSRQICIFCHTPHRAIQETNLLDAPLWNHNLSSATYTLKSQSSIYNQSSYIGNVILLSQPTQPDGASRLCLSCHDGTIAIGDLATGTIAMDTTHSCIDASGKLTNAVVATCPDLGTDLTADNKHVVSVPMNQGLIDASIANCNAGYQTTSLKYPWTNDANNVVLLRPTMAQYGGSYGVTRNTGRYKSGYYYGVQCSSCHDPHYWSSSSGAVGEDFLVKTFNALCDSCHVQGTGSGSSLCP
jgi:predicted CXXCH cytochrome family protein